MENKFYNNDIELLNKIKANLQIAISNMQKEIELIDEELERQSQTGGTADV